MLQVPQTTQEPEAPPTPPVPRRRSARRKAGLAALAVLVVVLAAAAGLFWQATRHSISLDLLRSRVEAALRARLPAESTVSIGSTALSYRSEDGIVLRARNVRLALPAMATVELGELATVTTPSALFSGRLDLSSVRVTGAEVGIAVPAVERVGSAADIARAALGLFMTQVGETDRLIRGAGLREIVVRDGALSILDGAGRPGPPLRIAEANWAPLGPDRSKLWMQVVEKAGGWDFTVERQQHPSGAVVNIEIEDLPLVALAPDLADGPDDDAYFESAVTLQARMVARQDGSFRGVRGVLSTGSGGLSVSGVDRMELAGAALSFALGAVGNRLAIPKAEIRTGTGNMVFEGALDLADPRRTVLAARIRGGALPTAGSGRPVRVTGGGVRANVDLVRQALQVERFELAAPGGSLSAAGEVAFGGEGAGLSLALSLSRMPAETARAFWPPFVAEKTRRWFDANVRSGTLGPGTLQIALPADHIGRRGRDRVIPPNGVVGSLPFEAAEFSPFKSFPPIRQASGYIDFGQATATVLAQSGAIAIEGKGELQVGGTILVVPELGRRDPSGDLHLQLAGPVAALAALSNNPPLSIAARRGIQPDALAGEAQLLLDGRIPLTETEFGGVESTFRLTLTDFTSSQPIENRLIADADLVIEGSSQSFSVKGEGTMDGLRATVDMMMGSGASDQSDVTVSLDDAARERLGLRLGGLVTGPVQASIRRSDPVNQQILLDLKDARIRLPALGWEKGAGVPATAAFVMEKLEDGTRIRELAIAGQGFGAKGELLLGADGKIREVNLSEVALRPADRIALAATAKGEGYEVRLSGGSLDVRGVLSGLRSGFGTKGESIPLRIAVDLDRVTGTNDVVLSEVEGSLEFTANGLQGASLTGAAERGKRFEWKLGREDGRRVLQLSAEDGGALIRFAGLYRKIAGGQLSLTYSGKPGGAGTGLVVMRDFDLLDETALAPAVQSARQAASRSGDGRAAASKAGDLHFTQLRIPFRQEGWILAVDDAALRGPMLGATASGTVNIPGQRVAISGTFIPAFGLNNIAGAIPIIGTILGGGRDEGLLGITYKLFGPIDGPKLAMNPISAIAPGIFRKIFEYR